MAVATSDHHVGVRELKNNLSRFLERVQQGEEFVVTDRGKPVARLGAVDEGTTKLQRLIDAGIVTPPKSTTRYRPKKLIKAKGSVSDIVIEQRG